MADFLLARFDVYANPGARAAATPFLLDVQSDLLDGLDSRMVIPLRDLASERERITAAVEFLFRGF
jgi:hypothetical protein